mmetsp:Transcript_6522/g.9832  ORF Transcript_6522/g.9832 Transcript_6522/m.9832 type:complete len:820 (+) Transcript_6522:118-2577(+)
MASGNYTQSDNNAHNSLSRKDIEAKIAFDQWAKNLGPDDHKNLKESLEGFLNESNTSVRIVAEWLRLHDAQQKHHKTPSNSINEGLRQCLQDLMSKNRSRSNSGFNQWLDNGRLMSPNSNSSEESSKKAETCRKPPVAIQRISINSEDGQNKPHYFSNTQSFLSNQAANNHHITHQLHQAQTNLLLRLPEENAADLAAAGWLSTEDEDFVTPWYTYVIRFIMFPLGFLIFYFIYWRIWNYPRSGIWWADACAWTFIVSEAICFLFGMTHWVWMWNLKFRKQVTQQHLNLTDDDLPTIDIMIPCYSEPTEIVEMTLKACYDMDYPAYKITCWICDDGGKEDMRDMVALTASEYRGEMKTRYVARKKIPGVPHHAKAGNLNNAILNEGSEGQLIIILDCDMMPEPCMARTVAPFFFEKVPHNDPEYGRKKAQFDFSTGLLQTPQAFYNLDSNDLLGQSYAFFYECLMSGWDGTGCTPCCGTGVTFSRYALTKVGGFSVGSITEDFKTSLNICANGFKCKFFLQRMTRGVSPKELNAFMVQRLRWAVGAIQIVKAGNPLFVKGLPFSARWLYFFSTVGIVYIIPVVMMGTIMYTTILAGFPISFGPTTFEGYLLIGGTAVGGMMLIQLLAGWRLSWTDYLRALQDNFTVFMTLIRALMIGFFGMEMGFAVTSKDVSFDLKANLFHAMPHIIVYLFSGAAAVKAVLEMLANANLIEIFWTTDYNVDLLYFSLMWTVFLWVMLSGPPRMVIYGYIRSRKEKKSEMKCKNANIPALQELPTTPMNIFPPLSPDLWAKNNIPDTHPRLSHEVISTDDSESFSKLHS